MLEGDVLVEKKLGPKGTPPGLVANIPKGMRAFAIDVTEQSGVSGFILPGHHVDVVRYEANEKNESRAETILQNVLVLAAGQLFTATRGTSVQSRTVTLALEARRSRHPGRGPRRGALSLCACAASTTTTSCRDRPKADRRSRTRKTAQARTKKSGPSSKRNCGN